MASKHARKNAPIKKKQGFSRTEKIAFPIIILVIVVFAGWAYYSSLQPGPTSSTLTGVNTASTSATQSGLAPDFTLPIVNSNGLTGQSLTLSSLRGKVVFLEFMEPWCPHCQNIAPFLDQLYAQYGKGNVAFVSVAGPWNGATASDAAGFISKYGSSWTFVYDSSGTIFSSYGVTSTPTFFIIAPDGTVSSMCNQGEQCSSTFANSIAAAGGHT